MQAKYTVRRHRTNELSGNVQHLLYLHTIILNLKRLLSIFELVQVYDEKKIVQVKRKLCLIFFIA